MVKVTDLWQVDHEFDPSTAEDSPCRGSMHVKSVESSSVLPLVWCGSSERGQLKCSPRHLTKAQNYEAHR
ncbi:hypothetical protein TNCV_1844311 [Trichonephila clavipes]|nr:hypothetical protein TNCV_1844311 [Trichonephila clavipes]